MAISDVQRTLRGWFRRHGWHTDNTPSGTGVWLQAPVEDNASILTRDPSGRCYYSQTRTAIEVDRFIPDRVCFSIYRRYLWEDGSERRVLRDHLYDSEGWPYQAEICIHMTKDELAKLAQIAEACHTEWRQTVKKRGGYNFFENIERQCRNGNGIKIIM